jgi:hypothetical protein
MALQTPVLLLAFSRPDTTRRVLERIRDAAPVRFYVACDAARNGRPAEAEKVEAVRALITELVDWPCEVRTLYRDQNLGCKLAVSGALDWFFAHEEMGIILEDDCLPDPSFFGYCESLLHRFKDDERIFMISGNNFQRGEKVTEYSYYYSWLTHIWGWASWRRSWQKVDLEMKNWPAFLAAGGVKQIYPKLRYARRWEKTFERYLQGRYNTWDYPLLFASWWHRQLTVLPEVNLVSNIGFGGEGTHMAAGDNNHLGNLSSAPIGELQHNTVKQANILADYRSMDFIYPRPIQVVLRKLKAFFGN